MRHRGLGNWIHRRREKSRGKTAIISPFGELSYDELADRIDQLAAALADAGVSRGDRVAYLGENHPAFLETLFATTSLGAIFVPLNTRLVPAEIAFALKDSGASVLIFSRVLEGLAVLAHRQLSTETEDVTEPSLGLLIAVNDGEPVDYARPDDSPEILQYEDFLASSAGAEHRDVPVALEDPAVILYTSGTTGNPKGAVLSHQNFTWNSFNVLVDYDVSSTDVAMMIAPMFHVASLGMGVLPMLLKGATVVLEPKFDPGRTLELIEKHQATSISGVPTTYQMLCEHPDWDRRDISSLGKLTCGGSAVPHRVMDAYEERGLSFSGGYGMTETSPGATSMQPAMSRIKAGSAGLPHFFTDIRIVDPLGEPCSVGEVGEIQIQGPNVIAEYWNRPDATAASYDEGGWFKSGDMGYRDEQGYLFISDRLKDMIISGGENIYPAQVEQEIAQLPQVGSVAVIGVPDEKWGEVPKAIIVLRDGFQLSVAEVREYLADRVAKYKIPPTVEFVADMPRTASGKIRKTDLRKKYAN
ncbi:acyl-CoA synthetase [Micrococcoides hystricis]|uniref:Long-chain fatty acid--CoA ligase n=1 Tax=Micrococcoides hystricis TaxID=1572761 RepID=A0ABV6PCK5_9MICC